MKILRPLLPKEHKLLDKQVKQLALSLRSYYRFLTLWILLACIAGIFAYFRIDATNKTLVTLLASVIAIYIGIGFWVVAEQYLKFNKKRKSIFSLKNTELVTSITVKSDKFYYLKENSDEGDHYLFQLDDNSVLSFGGQNFYTTKKFPNNHFEIVEGRGINDEIILLQVYNYGDKIKPIHTITGREKWELFASPNYPNPDNTTVIKGKIEDYI